MPTQTFKTADVLRLEVESTPAPGELRNLIQNPYADLGAWGWVSPVAGTQVVGPLNESGFTWFAFNPPSPAAAAYFTTEPVPVAAGQYVAARWEQASPDGDMYSRARVEWINAAGTVTLSAQSGYLAATSASFSSGGIARQMAAVQAPAGTVRARLRIDVYNSTAGAVPTLTFWFRRPVFVKGATSAAVTNPPLSALDPVKYTDITGPSTSLGIEREELNVGTLTATVLDASLDPSQGELIKLGKRVRVMVLGSGTWRELFTGKVTGGNTKYDLTRTDAKRARITLSAVDAVSQLAQVSAPRGVGTIDELSYVLEGAGVPWNVNGSGDQKLTATVVSTNDNAKVLDQVAITRDSRLGLAWVDRRGVLMARDRSAMWPGSVTTLDETAYSDLDVDWDSERCVNVVTIKLLRVNAATGETVEITRGPYVDQASVDKWGPHSKEFTVHGIADTEAAASAYAAQILAANATPVVRINAVTLPITSAADLTLTSTRRALLDLYDAVRLVNVNAAIDQVARPTSIKHTITPGKWLVSLAFAAEGGVAAPQQAPTLASAPANPEGWQALTHTGTSGTLRYQVLNGVVYVEGSVVIALAANATVTLAAAGAIPAGARPSLSMWQAIVRLSTGQGGLVARFADGSISVANPTGAAASSVQFAYCYPLG